MVATVGLVLRQRILMGCIGKLAESYANAWNVRTRPTVRSVSIFGDTCTRAAACTTVRLAGPTTPSAVAVIKVVPSLTAVTIPSLVMVATPGLELAQLNGTPGTARWPSATALAAIRAVSANRISVSDEGLIKLPAIST